MRKVLILVSVLVLSLLAIGCAKEDTSGQALMTGPNPTTSPTSTYTTAAPMASTNGKCVLDKSSLVEGMATEEEAQNYCSQWTEKQCNGIGGQGRAAYKCMWQPS